MNLVKNGIVNHLRWQKGSLSFLDQTCLPFKEEFIETSDYQEVCHAIQRLAIRGAPAIGIAGGYALVLGARCISAREVDVFRNELIKVRDYIASSRPTAVNLFWALNRLMSKIEDEGSISSTIHQLELEAEKIHSEDIIMCRKLSLIGKKLIPKNGGVMTHCNAGGLATGGYGTALGVIHSAFSSAESRNRIDEFVVIVNETRPLLQGARLTAWELKKMGIPFILITDNMAAQMFEKGAVKCVIVGADRIAINGDTANKIGTYNLAVLAHYHGIPFYVAAPTSTIDTHAESGREIPIEQRSGEEVTHLSGQPIAPPKIQVRNMAFDVTPSNLISGIITEKGIYRTPYRENIQRIL